MIGTCRATGLLATVGLAVLLAFALACNSSTPPPPVNDGGQVPQTSAGPSITLQPGPSASSMIPRARTAEELIESSQIIVLSTIDSVLEEKLMGGYGKDGKPTPAEEGGLPFTDYTLNIEEILKDDGNLATRETIVLRMFGHRNPQGTAVTLNSFTLPEVGDRLLFALGRNPDGTYGSGPEGLLDVNGAVVIYSDGQTLAEELSPDEFIQTIREATFTRASTPPEPPIFFIRQDEGTLERAVTDSVLSGNLVVQEGCLRVESAESTTSYIAVWPHRFQMEISGDQVHVRDGSGEFIASAGDEVSIPGGEIDSQDLSDAVSRKLSPNCPGPYWVVARDQYEGQTNGGVSTPPGASIGMPVLPGATGQTPPPTSPGIVIVDGDQHEVLSEGDFTSLLTIEDIESVASEDGRWNSQVHDYRAMAPPREVENIKSWYGVTFTSSYGGNGLTFTMMEFDSSDSAMAHFERMKDEAPPGATPTFDDTSFRAEVNAQGIGSILTLINDDKLLSFHTTYSEGEAVSISLEGLEQISKMILSRL